MVNLEEFDLPNVRFNKLENSHFNDVGAEHCKIHIENTDGEIISYAEVVGIHAFSMDELYYILDTCGSTFSEDYLNSKEEILNDELGEVRVLFISKIETKKDYRNQGLASELLDYVKSWAYDDDMEIALIASPSEDRINVKRLMRFYENNGFKAISKDSNTMIIPCSFNIAS